MAFFRKWFRGDAATNGDKPAEAEKDAPNGAQQPEAAPPAESSTPASPADSAEPTPAPAESPATDSAWWESSDSSADELPPSSQSATVAHTIEAEPAQAESALAEPELSPDETPTEPFRALGLEEAREHLAKTQEAEAPAPPVAAEPIEGTRQLDEASAPALTAWRSAQGLAAMASRDVGRVREVNQDSVFALLTTLPREASDIAVGLFVVADGMGGHQGGEVASRLAVRTVVHQVLSQWVLPVLDDTMTEALQPLMISAVQAANTVIWEAAQAAGTDMGTTCTAVLLVGQGLHIAHVGDSRAYLYEPGGLKLLTSDHSTVGRLIQLGQLDESEAREHPLRNQLYRTIGQQPHVHVDFMYQPIGVGSHVLLCSDGLWGMINEKTMEQALQRSPWPQDVCNELIALANLAGGEDNISAVVVSLPITER